MLRQLPIIVPERQNDRTEFHEQTKGGGTPRSTVDPHQDGVDVGVSSALKKVEEEMFGAVVDIEVPRERSRRHGRNLPNRSFIRVESATLTSRSDHRTLFS